MSCKFFAESVQCPHTRYVVLSGRNKNEQKIASKEAQLIGLLTSLLTDWPTVSNHEFAVVGRKHGGIKKEKRLEIIQTEVTIPTRHKATQSSMPATNIQRRFVHFKSCKYVHKKRMLIRRQGSGEEKRGAQVVLNCLKNGK